MRSDQHGPVPWLRAGVARCQGLCSDTPARDEYQGCRIDVTPGQMVDGLGMNFVEWILTIAIRSHVDRGKSTTTGRMILELGGIPDRDLLELETEAVMDAAVPCSWRRRALSAAITPRRRELA